MDKAAAWAVVFGDDTAEDIMTSDYITNDEHGSRESLGLWVDGAIEEAVGQGADAIELGKHRSYLLDELWNAGAAIGQA